MGGSGPWKFLSDGAVQNGEQDKFGVHSAYARVLYNIASSCQTPFTIALYSSWGTGKTSICNLVQEFAAEDNDLFYVYLDVWKYTNDPLKRWILLETHKSLTEQGAITDCLPGGRTLQSHLEFEEAWEDKDKLNVNFQALRWLALAVVILIALFIASVFLTRSAPTVWRILSELFGFLATAGVAALLFESVIKEMFKSLSGLVVERTVKNISAKPAFSSEKFGELFREIVRAATAGSGAEKKRIIFTFDNLDRCSESVAVETIGVIKTYLDEPGCVYIIPCDEVALMKHIAKSYTSEHGDNGSRKYAKEFLNKFFQTTLRLPVAPEFDIEQYLDEQLRLAGMTDLPADARDVLVLGYLGQTPRQIKRVLNDLTAYRYLAVQAEEDMLVEKGALTSDLSLLTKMSVISVEWPDFLNALADDPELWADLMNKISTGQKIEETDVRPDLVSFLHATRHVSPEADIRPFIYLKRVRYERNVALAKSVQDQLRKGDAKGFLELLRSAKSEIEQEEILRIATDLARRWLDAPRDVFLKNAASVLLKAANEVPGNRHLELTVSDLLEYLSKGKPGELAEVITLPDLFAFEPSVQTTPKEQCLARLVEVFEPSTAITKNHSLYWKQLLENQNQLDGRLRAKLRGFIQERYPTSESDALQMLYDAAQDKTHDTSWVAGPSVLKAVVARTTLSGDDVDKQRLAVIVRYHAQMDGGSKELLANTLVTSLGPRTRAVDTQAKSAMDLLGRLESSALDLPNFDKVASTLVEQVNAHGPFAEKASWLSPLIVIRKALSPGIQAQVDALYRGQLLDASDPGGLSQLLSGMGSRICALLLELPENVKALHDQAGRLEARFGAGQAPALREQILKCFFASTLLNNLEAFDENRSWDLSLFSAVVARGVKGKVPVEKLKTAITTFVDRFLLGKATKHTNVLDSLMNATREAPDLLDESVARSLSSCCLEVIGLNVEKYYADLRFLGTKLAAPSRLSLVQDIVGQILKPRQPQWIQILQKLAEDLETDETLAGQESLITELTDYAFEAARVSPAEAETIFIKLIPHASLALREQNVDESLDRLLGLEGSGSSTAQMQPYLVIMNTIRPDLKPQGLEKLEKYCSRMLGPAKTDEEKSTVLKFLAQFSSQSILKRLSPRISELAVAEDTVGQLARTLVDQESVAGNATAP